MTTSMDFTDASTLAIGRAFEIAKDNSHAQVSPVHLALALYDEAAGAKGDAGRQTQSTSSGLLKNILTKAGGDPVSYYRALNKLLVRQPVQNPAPLELGLSAGLRKILNQAQHLQKQQHDSFIALDHLILAMIEDKDLHSILKDAGGVTEAQFKAATESIRGNKRVDSKNDEAGLEALKKYATDLTALAEQGKLDPVIGRDDEIRRVVRILSRRQKNNPVLIGEPGVGKTSIVEGLAQRIVNRDVPANLLGRLWNIDVAAVVAGAKYRGEMEERWKSLLAEIDQATKDGQNIICFIDEIHLLTSGQGGEGGGMDAANMLKEKLARGALRLIGATTLNEYRKYIEKDSALERRFQQVIVREPSVEDAVSILRGLKEKYELHHAVTILDTSLVAAARLAARYLSSRKLPDSAIDLVDEACAAVRVARDSQPEAIDRLERQKTRLQVEIHALSKEKDTASQERLYLAKKEMSAIDEELSPLKLRYENEKSRGNEIAEAKTRLEEYKVKAENAARNGDHGSAADLLYGAIPDLQERIKQMEAMKAKEEMERRERAASGSAASMEEGDILVTDTVTPDHITEIVSRWTGIPAQRMKTTEREKLLKMEKLLTKEVVGQPEAVKAVSNAIRLSRSGMKDANRPVLTALFLGPSGTGKTQLAKALAKFLFDDENSMVRIDMSEYSAEFSTSRLIGAPPGYVGHDESGQLTEAVRRRPFSVILLDEIEKAAKQVHTLLLQVLDAGRLTDGQGRTVDFRNTCIIMTSNVGAQFINMSKEAKDAFPAVQSALAAAFPPEFLNRIDSTVIFNKLTKANIRKIVEIRLVEVQNRLIANGRHLTLELSDRAKDWLGEAGYSPNYGARPLNRVIQTEILNPLAKMLLSEHIKDNEIAKVDLDVGRNKLLIRPNHDGLTMSEDDMDVDGQLNDDEDSLDGEGNLVKVEEID